MVSLAEKIRSELWGFFALAGLFCIHTGIVLSVFALKHVTTHPTLLKGFGILLIIIGIVATLASWYFHRQMREKRPMFPCCARCCPSCCDCEADLIILNNENERRKRKTERKIAPVSSGFSTLEFQMYSDYMKKEIRGVEGSYRDKSINWSQAQNAIYTHQSNHVSGKVRQERRHRQEISTIGKPRFQDTAQAIDRNQHSQSNSHSISSSQH